MECDDSHERKTIQLELLKNIQIISYAAREADVNSLMHGQSSHEMEDFSILILIKNTNIIIKVFTKLLQWKRVLQRIYLKMSMRIT